MVESEIYYNVRDAVEIEMYSIFPKSILKIKGKCPLNIAEKHPNFKMTISDVMNWNVIFNNRSRDAKTVLYWFQENGDYICDLWIKDMYGNISNALNSNKSFNELWNNYLNWFNHKRTELRNKMKQELRKSTGNASQELQIPRSHGGVANLLKVLTKTMKMQGADIRSIAKVQYSICTQAGIYIPDEFIEDVAVVMMCENPDVMDK